VPPSGRRKGIDRKEKRLGLCEETQSFERKKYSAVGSSSKEVAEESRWERPDRSAPFTEGDAKLEMRTNPGVPGV
jgi:hypothetical protein